MNILLLGGAGVFGQRIHHFLAQNPGCTVFSSQRRPATGPGIIQLDTTDPTWPGVLKQHKINLVINLAGPFQDQDYQVAIVCIEAGCHYIDLADGRDYVRNFGPALDALAKKHNVVAITGASTVPAIASAIIDDLKEKYFSRIETLEYGVTPGNRTPRGLATVAAILTYVGESFTTLKSGQMQPVYGWQGLHQHRYPGLGKRWFSYCDIPDLDLFSEHYPELRNIRFSAGLEFAPMHLGLWGLSWLRRWRLLPNLRRYAHWLRAMSMWFYPFGTDKGGMHIILSGRDRNGQPIKKDWYLIARNGHGPFVPATPAIILAGMLATENDLPRGAIAACGLLRRIELQKIWHQLDIEEIEP